METEPTAIARHTDPETSHEAANSVTDVRASQFAVYLIINALGGATDEELLAKIRDGRLAMSDSGARTRRSELVKMGWVRDSGERKRTKAGRRTIVWVTA